MSRTVLAAFLHAGLAFCALSLVAWFAVHSQAFAAEVQARLDAEARPGLIDVERIEWIGRGRVAVYGLKINGRDGRPILVAGRALVDVDLDQLRLKKRDVVLVARAIEVEDFELSLEWNRFRKLNLGSLFRTRTFGLVLGPPPPSKTDIRLDGIVLKNGRLHLIWPTYGFSFDAIDTAGTVHVSNERGLEIDVAALDAGESRAWFPGDRLSEVPIDSVAIREFAWEGTGFRGRIRVPSPLGATVDAALSMDFPEEGETGLTTDATVEMNAGLVKRFADRWAKGPARLRFETNGRDEVSVEARLERLSIAGIEATAPDFEADLQLQDRDEAFFQLMGLVFSPPELPLSWIQALPKRLEVPRLDAAALGAERDVAIRDVKVEVGVNVFSLTATAKGSFADVPPALLTRIFPDAPALQGPQPPRVTGAFEVTVDPAKPKDTRRELTLGSSP